MKNVILKRCYVGTPNSIKVASAIGHWAFGHTNTMKCFAGVTAKQ